MSVAITIILTLAVFYMGYRVGNKIGFDEGYFAAFEYIHEEFKKLKKAKEESDVAIRL